MCHKKEKIVGACRKLLAGLTAVLVTASSAAGNWSYSLPPLIVSASAAEIDVGDFTVDIDKNAGTATVTKYSGVSTSVENIPEYVTGTDGISYKVTAIGAGAFASKSNLRAVTIPDGVTSVGERAFNGCTNLQSVVMPEGLRTIGDYAFNNCTSLGTVNLPSSIKSIGAYAFNNCISLTTVSMPSSAYCAIGAYAFSGCSALTSISGITAVGQIPACIASVDLTAFRGCSSLRTISLPDGISNIRAEYFLDCSNLTALTVPQNAYIESLPADFLNNANSQIWGFTGSPAETYANSHGVTFMIADYTTPMTSLEAPVLTGQAITGMGARLTWNTVSGATSYDVYRYTGSSSVDIYLKTVTSPTCTDYPQDSGTYRYYVVAKRGTASSSRSNIVTITVASSVIANTVKVSGTVTGFGEIAAYEELFIELLDSNGNQVDSTTSESGAYTFYNVEDYSDYKLVVNMSGCPVRTYPVRTRGIDVRQNAVVRRYGDANGNGKIDKDDPTLILRYDAGYTSALNTADAYTLAAVSLFGESKPTAKDATQILRYLAIYPSRFDNLL